MFTEVLPGKTKSVLALLGAKEILPPKTYLAGGTACALQLGHRISYDLDYFTTTKFSVDLILEKLKKLDVGYSTQRTAEQTILGDFPEAKFSLFYYPYPLVGESVIFENNLLASLKDIAAMKINAISDRGKMRDFVDLYFIIEKENYSLDLVLQFYDERFGALKSNRAHILKSLMFFEDAEAGDEPNMLIPWNWQKIKKFFIDEIVRFEKKNLGI